MPTLWAYRTDPGQGIRALLEGGRVEWQWGADRGWSTLREIELAAQVHSSPAVVEALRNLLEWARADLALQAGATDSVGIDRLIHHRRSGRWTVAVSMVNPLGPSAISADAGRGVRASDTRPETFHSDADGGL